MTRQQLVRTEQVVDEVRSRAEQSERDFNFRFAALDQERQAALHELESIQGELQNASTEMGRLKGQVRLHAYTSSARRGWGYGER